MLADYRRFAAFLHLSLALGEIASNRIANQPRTPLLTQPIDLRKHVLVNCDGNSLHSTIILPRGYSAFSACIGSMRMAARAGHAAAMNTTHASTNAAAA